MSTTVLERIHRIFAEHDLYREKKSIEILESLKTLIYRTTSDKHDLVYLYKIFPEDLIVKLIDYYNGATIRIPSKKEYRDTLILVMAFYLKEIEGHDWKYIKEVLSVDRSFSINGKTLGKKIQEVKQKMTKDMYNLFESIEFESFMSLLEQVEDR